MNTPHKTMKRLERIAMMAQMPPAELAVFTHAENVMEAADRLDAAKRGISEPNVFVNGCKTRAALIRKYQFELAVAQNSPAQADLWGTMIEAAYAKLPISAQLVNGFSGERNSRYPEFRSMREQAIENLTDKGYALQGDSFVFAIPAAC